MGGLLAGDITAYGMHSLVLQLGAICHSSAVWWQALLHIGLLSAATAASTHAIAVNFSNHSDCVQLAHVSTTVMLNQDLSSTCLQRLGVLVILQQHWTLTYYRQTVDIQSSKHVAFERLSNTTDLGVHLCIEGAKPP